MVVRHIRSTPLTILVSLQTSTGQLYPAKLSDVVRLQN